MVSPGRKENRCPPMADALLRPTDQVHFDAAMAGIVNRLVPEGGKIEIAPSSRLMRASKLRLKAAVTPARSS